MKLLFTLNSYDFKKSLFELFKINVQISKIPEIKKTNFKRC
jgi:hypothetical protein